MGWDFSFVHWICFKNKYKALGPICATYMHTNQYGKGATPVSFIGQQQCLQIYLYQLEFLKFY